MTTQTFKARLEVANDVGGRFVQCPFDGRETYGEARPAVVGTVNGHPFRSRLMVYGGKTYLGFTKQVREAADIQDGMTLKIVLERDTAPREVKVPDDLQRALDAEPALRDVFTKLSFTNRKEIAQALTEAKREETRARRLTQTLEKLRARAVE